MNPDIFKIYRVEWDAEKNVAEKVVLEHIETGKQTTLVSSKQIKKAKQEGKEVKYKVKKDFLLTKGAVITVKKSDLFEARPEYFEELKPKSKTLKKTKWIAKRGHKTLPQRRKLKNSYEESKTLKKE